MAEERTRTTKDLDTVKKRNTTLEGILRGMQEQGRAPVQPSVLEGSEEEEGSDYEDEDYDDDEEDSQDYDEEETEDDAELQSQRVGLAPAYGPVPPPPPSNQPQVNGRATHNEINGVGKNAVVA